MSYMSIFTDPRQGVIYAVAADKTNGVLDGGASRDTLSAARGVRAPLPPPPPFGSPPSARTSRRGPRSGGYIQEVR